MIKSIFAFPNAGNPLEFANGIVSPVCLLLTISIAKRIALAVSVPDFAAPPESG